MTGPAPQAAAVIELRDLQIATSIGTYGPGDVVPDAHLLDLTLAIAPDLVLVDEDAMARVFDYDPLIADIDRLARDRPYATQEYLMTRIVEACAAYPAIRAVDICLRKRPVLDGTGTLGVRLTLGADALDARRPG
ncbi:MAG: dihydroneopterin aldolase [Rhodobacteraceae bacterium]|jgi:dihydroneopterin aldolase|nr:dihydroneopterin aldolase [Paracoccaceae bacterium]